MKRPRRLAWLSILGVLVGAGCRHTAGEGPEDPPLAPHERRLVIGGAHVQVFFPEDSRLPEDGVLAWVRAAGEQVAAWYGRFPVARVVVRLEPRAGRGVTFGTAHGHAAVPLIRILIGEDSSAEDLADDWVLTHEMVHLGFPVLRWDRDWLSEGLATYVEAVARVRAGVVPVERFWERLVRSLPMGQPRRGDRGLDHTPTWARVYWGGALFYFLADLEIVRATEGERGLEHALRGVIDAGMDIRRRVALDALFDAAADGSGTDVLRRLHAVHGAAPVRVDLDAIFRDLGVVRTPRGVRLDDDAPGARWRRRLAGEPEPRIDAWTSLFDGRSLGSWEPTAFGGEGDVRVEDGRLVLDFGNPLTGVTWRGAFPDTNYELRLRATRVEGSDFFCGLTFPVAASHASLILGGWGGSLVGISSIDGKDASENETTSYRTFERGREVAVRLRVTPERLTAWVDEEVVADVELAGRAISIRPEVSLSRPLGIATFATTGAVRDVAYRLLSDADGTGS